MSVENLFLAWRKFRKGKRYKTDVLKFAENIEEHIFTLHNSLKFENWKHGKYTTFMIRDPKMRRIHKATVTDRVVHQAVVNILEPMFEPTFLPQAWSCREGKGVSGAIDDVHDRLENTSRHGTKNIYVLQCDIRKFFASVDRMVLFELLVKNIRDERMLNLISEILDSHAPGLPLGNVTSQLFANVIFTPLDRYIVNELQPLGYARYCDDLLLIGNDPMVLGAMSERISEYCVSTLHMELHPSKTTIRKYCSGIDWLGVRLFPGGRRRMRATTKRRAWKKIDEIVRALHGGDINDEHWKSVASSYNGAFARGFARNDLEKVELMKMII